MAARRRCSPWPAAPVRYNTGKASSELPRRTTDLTRQKASETGQKRARFDAAELSGEVGATPTSDSRRSMGSHLGRTFAGAYRDDGECSGSFGVEVGALVWPAVSSGAAPVMVLRRSSYGCGCAREWRDEGERRGRQSEWSGLGARAGVPTR